MISRRATVGDAWAGFGRSPCSAKDQTRPVDAGLRNVRTGRNDADYRISGSGNSSRDSCDTWGVRHSSVSDPTKRALMPQPAPPASGPADSKKTAAPQRPAAAVGNVPFAFVLLSAILTLIPPTRPAGIVLLLLLFIPALIVWVRARKRTDGSRGLTSSALIIGATAFVIGVAMTPTAETPAPAADTGTAPPVEQAAAPPVQPPVVFPPAPQVAPAPQPVVQAPTLFKQPAPAVAPATRVAPAPAPGATPKPVQKPRQQAPAASSGKAVRPGAFCSQGDAGLTVDGTPMVCGTKDKNGRYHWRRA